MLIAESILQAQQFFMLGSVSCAIFMDIYQFYIRKIVGLQGGSAMVQGPKKTAKNLT